MAIEFIRRELCPVCNRAKTTTLSDISFQDSRLLTLLERYYAGRVDSQALRNQRFEIVKCSHCSMIYQPYVLNEEGMQSLYGDWIDNQRSLQKKLNAMPRLVKQYTRQVNLIARLCKRPAGQISILEFGMGWGYWSQVAQNCGYRVHGLELSQTRARHARNLGIKVLDHLADCNPGYDFIFANQVFEHLVDPADTLKQLVSILQPGGVIYLRVPDGRHVAGYLQKRGWDESLNAVHPLEHINCFRRETLIALAQHCGLVPIHAPFKVNFDNIRAGLKREFSDRFITTHIYFEKKYNS